MPEKETYLIQNTMDTSVNTIPDQTITLEEYKQLGGIASVEMSPTKAVFEAARHADGSDVPPLHRSSDTSAESTRTERRLHPYQHRS